MQNLVSVRIEGALRLERVVQQVHGPVVTTNIQQAAPQAMAGAVRGESMQLDLMLLKEREFLERKAHDAALLCVLLRRLDTAVHPVTLLVLLAHIAGKPFY